MAAMTLSDLLTALVVSIAKAQRTAHDLSRQYVEFYTSDAILRTFRIPNFEFDTLQIDVPVRTLSVSGRPNATQIVLEHFLVVLKKQAIGKELEAKIAAYLQNTMGFQLPRASQIVAEARKRDVPLLVSSDKDKVDRLAVDLVRVGAKISKERRQTKSGARDLMVETEQIGGDTPTVIRIQVRPRAMRLVKDAEAIGERFIVEPIE
jgi:hypothetical protein